MNINKATIYDLDGIVPLFERYLAFYEQKQDLAAIQKFLELRITSGESVIFYNNNYDRKITAFVQLYPSYSSLKLKKTWILNDLYVLPDYRKQGLAKKLVVHSQNFARECGAESISLMTSISNLTAQKLYLGLGWSKCEDFFTFTKKL